MGRPGRPDWTTKVPPAELQVIHEWIDSDADYAAADIFRHLNLVRYTRPRTFAMYVQRRRGESKERVREGSLPPSPFSARSVVQLAMDRIGKCLVTGEMPAYALAGVLGMSVKALLLELSGKLGREAAQEGLTDEQVSRIRAKVFGI